MEGLGAFLAEVLLRAGRANRSSLGRLCLRIPISDAGSDSLIEARMAAAELAADLQKSQNLPAQGASEILAGMGGIVGEHKAKPSSPMQGA